MERSRDAARNLTLTFITDASEMLGESRFSTQRSYSPVNVKTVKPRVEVIL